MATETEYPCRKCRQMLWYSLFEGLTSKAGEGLKCPTCGSEVDMNLTFSFGLKGRVIDAFLPDDINEWDDKNEHWEFYPFLVVIGSLKKDDPWLQVWQPYWHKVTAKNGSVRTPYGQWATCLDIGAFQQVLTKARKRGYFER